MSERIFGAAGYRRKPDSGVTVYELTKAQIRYLFWKRMLDIAGAAAAIALLAVPMLTIALILKLLYPQDPVLFRQERVGKNGELFMLFKFSSMEHIPDHEDCVPLQTATEKAAEHGERVTKFGHFLRCTSLDELPQLFQVLSGKMSLVGPRPLVPQEKEMHAMRWSSGVYRLRPGITGWAQVNGRRRLSDEKKAAFDRDYLEKISFSLDWRIFWMTIKQVIRREGVDE